MHLVTILQAVTKKSFSTLLKKSNKIKYTWEGAVAKWVRALDWRPDVGLATLPVSFGGDTKSRRSLLSGVYAWGSKRSHQSALECVTVVDSTSHSKPPAVRLCGGKCCPALKKKNVCVIKWKIKLFTFIPITETQTLQI